MKRLLLGLGLIFTGITGFAQSKIFITPEVGMTLMSSVYSRSAFGVTYKTDGAIRPGLKLGAALNIPIEHFAIQPGLYYNMGRTSFRASALAPGRTGSAAVTLHAIEIPVNLMYFSKKDIKGGFFAGVGPYVDFNFAAREVDKYGGVKAVYKLGIGSSAYDDIKPFDFGVGITAGYVMTNKVSLRAYFNLGLINEVPGSDASGSVKMKNRTFGIMVGYNL